MTARTRRTTYAAGSYAIVEIRFRGYGVVKTSPNGRPRPAFSEPDPVTGRARLVPLSLGDAIRIMQDLAREEYADAADARMRESR